MSGYACSLYASSENIQLVLYLEIQQVVIAAITAKPWLIAHLVRIRCLAPLVHDPCNCSTVNGDIATATLKTTFGACALKPPNSIDLLIVARELLARAYAL